MTVAEQEAKAAEPVPKKKPEVCSRHMRGNGAYECMCFIVLRAHGVVGPRHSTSKLISASRSRAGGQGGGAERGGCGPQGEAGFARGEATDRGR